MGIVVPHRRGGHFRLLVVRRIRRWGADRQVGAPLAVGCTLAHGVGGADVDDAHRAHAAVQRRIVGLDGTVAAGKDVDGTQAVAACLQPVAQRVVVARPVGFRRGQVSVVRGAPAVVVDMVPVQIARQGIQRVGHEVGGQDVEAHQLGAWCHARDAGAIAVAGGDQACHRGAVRVIVAARHGEALQAGNLAAAGGGQTEHARFGAVVAAAGHDVGPQVFVRHFQPVVQHRHADAFTAQTCVPDRLHAQVLARLHAGESGQGAGILQVPLERQIGVGTGVGNGSGLRARVFQGAVRPAQLGGQCGQGSGIQRQAGDGCRCRRRRRRRAGGSGVGAGAWSGARGGRRRGLAVSTLGRRRAGSGCRGRDRLNGPWAGVSAGAAGRRGGGWRGLALRALGRRRAGGGCHDRLNGSRAGAGAGTAGHRGRGWRRERRCGSLGLRGGA